MSQADHTEPPTASAALAGELALFAQAPGSAIDRELLAAYAASAAPNSLRAFRADVTTFDAWCHAQGCRCLPASPQLAAAFLAARAGEGAAPASLTRYRASIAKLHRLCLLPDPCQDELVRLTLAAHRRAVGVAQKQARPLRFKGAVRDPLADAPRSKGDQEGEGATAYLSPRSVSASTRWLDAAGIGQGPVFRRVIVRRYAAKPAIAAQGWGDKAWNTRWVPVWEKGRAASRAQVEYDIGAKALHAGSVTPIFREVLRRAFKAGAFGDLDETVFAEQLKQISAHSTRVGINQDYFAAGENLAGIMDALRWKLPRMPLLYNRNRAAEQGAAGRLLGKLV